MKGANFFENCFCNLISNQRKNVDVERSFNAGNLFLVQDSSNVIFSRSNTFLIP